MSDSPSFSEARVYTIAPGQSFLEVLACTLFDDDARMAMFGAAALDSVQILLPTRRAARELANLFLRLAETQGQGALLLPRINTLGDLDEDAPQIERDRIDVPPAVEPMARHFYLLPLIRRWAELTGQSLNPVKLSGLAFDLERFLDQAQNEQVAWDKLPDLVPDALAENWQQTLGFLDIITKSWPTYLDEIDALDPTARRNALLEKRAQEWRDHPPDHPIIAAGSTGTIRATADLLSTIAHLPKGAVVLPGLDKTQNETVWQAIESDVAHPQYAMAQLLAHMHVPRDAVDIWPSKTHVAAPLTHRVAQLNLALVPAAQTADWAHHDSADAGQLGACHLVEAPDARTEAGVIALIMRETLEDDTKTAALVTRDRNLARRVAGELRRWDITVDDSAGLPLSNSQSGGFLRLILACWASDFAPVDLLALLKHPKVRLDAPRATHLSRAYMCERYLLRGARVVGGLAALRLKLSEHAHLDDTQRAEMAQMIDALAQAFAPLMAFSADGASPTPSPTMRNHLDALLACATELMGGGDSLSDLLGGNEEGRALASLIERLYAQSQAAGSIASADWPALFDMWMKRQTLRPQTATQARLAIWGPLEARLMQADVMILGGLNETSWPPLPETGPWLSRPMRAALGMSQPERQIGLAAHDFIQGAAAPTVYVTRAQKIDGAPSVAARWLRRLETLCGELPRAEEQRLLGWWAALDGVTLDGGAGASPKPADAPAPCPPVAARPTQLSVTQIETLLHNPYEIYAKKILNLQEMELVDAPVSAADRGTLLHGVMEKLVKTGAHRGDDVAAQLLALAEAEQRHRPNGAAILQYWQARLMAVADWVAAYEAARGDEVVQSYVELRGRMQIDAGGSPFHITAKADRIDARHNNRFEIIDYKTGAVPTQKSVAQHTAPQLTLEAAILAAGGFEVDGVPLAGACDRLSYVQLSGRDPAARVIQIECNDKLVRDVREMVADLIAGYRDAARPYLVHIRPKTPNFSGAYDHLARRKEWQTDGGVADG